jgi:glycosyltransferase involved in cell wall biosynthesis
VPALPLLSVCIPTYNHAGVVADALSSALAQSYPGSLEILVLDNHSTDDTGSVVRKAASGDPRVRYVRNAENIGMAANFSACIAMARGEYVQILCADDVLEPACARTLATALHDNPRAVLAACGRILTDGRLNPLRTVRPRLHREVVEGPALIRECFLWGNRIGDPCAVMFRREAGRRGFSPEYSQLIDLEMWLHLLAGGNAVLLPDPLCRVRGHAEQTTQANIRSGRIVEERRRLFRQFLPGLRPPLAAWEKLLWDSRMAHCIARAQTSGSHIDTSSIDEVFNPSLFLRLLLPAIAQGWRLVRSRADRQ